MGTDRRGLAISRHLPHFWRRWRYGPAPVRSISLTSNGRWPAQARPSPRRAIKPSRRSVDSDGRRETLIYSFHLCINHRKGPIKRARDLRRELRVQAADTPTLHLHDAANRMACKNRSEGAITLRWPRLKHHKLSRLQERRLLQLRLPLSMQLKLFPENIEPTFRTRPRLMSVSAT